MSDKFMWPHTRNDKFTIKSAYRIYINDIAPLDDSVFWRKVWSIDCLPKIKFFLWKIFAYMIPVNSMLQFYNPDVDVIFPLCHCHEETVLHLFIKCTVARHIWFGVSLLHLISPDLDWIDDYFLYWHNSDLGESPFNVSWPSIGTITMWYIWKLRCDVIFRNASIDLNKFILDTKRMFNIYISPRIRPADVHSDIKIPIAEVDHFMFVDGSFKDFNMGLGVIWCDVAGNVRSSCSDYGLIPDAVGAKAGALILAISWAEEMNLSRVVFVSDCIQLVHFINGVNSNIAWISSDLLDRCRSLISSSVSFKIMYIKRVKNHLADRLARRARKLSLSGLPSFFFELSY
ncbi:uncharacterized protein LOC113315544 [Papaver somniferum]|uniref:uncharacterized protein LOC113315544 n=1 Tax=Papaver somniferum TaxID=3469 RepID=UPI000E7045F4|nr:uncharacterized protein LOC113315544 [Papaver somniferum]